MSGGPSVARRLVGEGVGTALLLAVVVGSGIMGERLAGGNVAIALLANTIATGAGLVALILTFGPVSGAHFNPIVSTYFCLKRELTPKECAGYFCAQFLGGIVGIFIVHFMFGDTRIICNKTSYLVTFLVIA